MEKIPVFGVEEFVKSSEKKSFYANVLSHHLKEHQFINHHHKHSTYVTIFFTHGTGEHIIDFLSYPVQRGHIFILKPGQVHRWTLSPDSEGFIFFHTLQYYDTFFQSFSIETFPFFSPGTSLPLIQIPEEHIEHIQELFREVLNEYKLNRSFKEIMLLSLITRLYAEFSRLSGSSGLISNENSYLQNVKRLQKLIEENYCEKKQAGDYAELMNMTSRHLNRITQETLGISTTELIQNRIILEAKRLLIHKNTTVTLIADGLGFNDHSYFIRLFRKKTGLTPKQFVFKMI